MFPGRFPALHLVLPWESAQSWPGTSRLQVSFLFQYPCSLLNRLPVGRAKTWWKTLLDGHTSAKRENLSNGSPFLRCQLHGYAIAYGKNLTKNHKSTLKYMSLVHYSRSKHSILGGFYPYYNKVKLTQT